MLQTALSNLSQSERIAAVSESTSVDWGRGQIFPRWVYQHGMLMPDESLEQMHEKMDAFVREHENNALTAWVNSESGITKDALTEFGKAMHPLMDETSPMHQGKVFYGIPSAPATAGASGLFLDLVGAWLHNRDESKITIKLYHEAIDKIRREYLKTFGVENFKAATGCDRVEDCPYDDHFLELQYRQ